jgi:phage baseplate assembly protein W
MARSIYQYKPTDNSEQAIGILLPLNKSAKGKSPSSNYADDPGSGKGVFESSYTTQQAVISNLQNLILTTKGERYMQPEFGTSIKTVLFENNTIDMRDILQSTIEDDIGKWLPYVKLTSLDIVSSSDMYSINIKLYFKITTIGANIVINILANENEFQVTDITETANLQLVGSFGSNTAFNTGRGGSF